MSMPCNNLYQVVAPDSFAVNFYCWVYFVLLVGDPQAFRFVGNCAYLHWDEFGLLNVVYNSYTFSFNKNSTCDKY